MRRYLIDCLILAALVFLTACSRPDQPVEVFDPYEAQNRATHEFNVSLDRRVVRPAANAYGESIPAPVRGGVSNLSDYLSTPGYILNDLAQGNIGDAGHNFARMIVNTIFGFGLLDPATEAGIARRRSDFGETLYVWGVPEGAYVVQPVLGPSTERETFGLIVDIVTNPVAYALDRSVVWVSPAVTAGAGLDTRYRLGPTLDALIDESADSYSQARNLYLQNRRFALGQEDEFAFDPYEDLPDE